MTATCKLGEKGCWNDGKCRATSNCKYKVITNADRIRAMSDEELAEFLSCYGCPCPDRDCHASCKDCVVQWLKQPAEGE